MCTLFIELKKISYCLASFWKSFIGNKIQQCMTKHPVSQCCNVVMVRRINRMSSMASRNPLNPVNYVFTATSLQNIMAVAKRAVGPLRREVCR